MKTETVVVEFLIDRKDILFVDLHILTWYRTAREISELMMVEVSVCDRKRREDCRSPESLVPGTEKLSIRLPGLANCPLTQSLRPGAVEYVGR